MNAPQGVLVEGPISQKSDAVITVPNGAGLLVKRTSTGIDVAGAGDNAIGVIFDSVAAIGDYVAVWPLTLARFPVVVSADGNLATIGTAVVPDTGGKVKAGANTAASGKLITDSAGNVGEIIWLVTGC